MRSYQDWKKEQVAKGGYTSFDRYRDEFPDAKEYICVHLNPDCQLAHDDNSTVLFASDNLGECCAFVYEQFKIHKKDIAVWQERTNSYRDIYQNKRRDSKGRFIKV